MSKWWKEDQAGLANAVFDTIEQLDAIDSTRKSKILHYSRMYCSEDIAGLDPFNYFSIQDFDLDSIGDTAMRWNVIASIIDTLVSRIAKNKPRIVMLPNRNVEVQRKAKDLEKFLAGSFEAIDIYRLAPIAFLHACISGTGVIHPYSEDGNIYAELVPPHEIKIDPHESMYGNPRSMMREKHIEKETLSEMFPKARGDIAIAGTRNTQSSIAANSNVSELVTVLEAWHLPSKPGAGDGRHVITIDNNVLFDEVWEDDAFPFAFIRWKEPVHGFWGIGVVADLMGIQYEINDTLERIQEAHHALSNPMVFVESGSSISKDHINDEIGNIIPYTGARPPSVHVFGTVHPEIYQHLERLERSAYQIAGVSQMSAQSKNILGSGASGEAFRQMTDLESERFALASQEYERFYLEVAKQVLRLGRRLYTNNEDISFSVKGKEFLSTVSWSEVDMNEDLYDLKVGAASILPDTKSGRISTALELLQAGVWDVDQFSDALDISDIASERELNRSPRDYIKEVVGMIINTGVIIEPEKYDDLQYAFKYAMMSYNKARLSGAPEENLELLRQYIEKVNYLLTPQEQEQAVASPPPPTPQMPSPPRR